MTWGNVIAAKCPENPNDPWKSTETRWKGWRKHRVPWTGVSVKKTFRGKEAAHFLHYSRARLLAATFALHFAHLLSTVDLFPALPAPAQAGTFQLAPCRRACSIELPDQRVAERPRNLTFPPIRRNHLLPSLSRGSPPMTASPSRVHGIFCGRRSGCRPLRRRPCSGRRLP